MEYLFPFPHFQSICVPRSEASIWSVFLIDQLVKWILFLYPFSQPMSLVGALNPFTFKVIIDICIPIAVFLIVWIFCCCCWSSSLLSLVVWWLVLWVLFFLLSVFNHPGSSLLCEGFLQLCCVEATLYLWSVDFSLERLLSLWSTGFRAHGFSSCHAQA